MFSQIARIASKGSFSTFQRNPRLFCSQSTNVKNSSSGGQVPHSLVKKTESSTGGGVSIVWMGFSVYLAALYVRKWFKIKEEDKETEWQDNELKRLKKEIERVDKLFVKMGLESCFKK